ncbi:MAG: hypothetical protein JSR54_07450 [Proteobacteria bacterium]|nr:hypothetical protein [Pseudomonadota bacterium]
MRKRELLAVLRARFRLDWHGDHGLAHWMRVRANGLELCAATGARVDVVEAFAFVHDVERVHEHGDPGHGPRAALFAREVNDELLLLDDSGLETLEYACAYHSEGLLEGDVTVQCCWDADRGDLARVGIRPRAERLCLDSSRDPAWLDNAIRRSRRRPKHR